MNAALIVGQKMLWLPFREQLFFYQEGLSHNGKLVLWNDIRRIKIMRYQSYHRRGPLTKWNRMTIETKDWKVNLDSRITVRSGDNSDNARWKINYNISPAFDEAKKFYETFASDKIIYKNAFAGGLDFEEWSSWIVVALILLPVIFTLIYICQSVRPLFM